MNATTTVQPQLGRKILIPRARLAFPDLFEMRSVDGGKPSYGATFILLPTDPVLGLIVAEEERVAQEKWGAKAPTILAMIRANNRASIKPGVLKAKFDGFDGNFFVSTNMQRRPTVVNSDASPLTTADGKIYAGCYVLSHIALWAQDNQYGQRINVECTGVQFVEDGDAFGGGAPPSSVDDFANLSAAPGAAPVQPGGFAYPGVNDLMS